MTTNLYFETISVICLYLSGLLLKRMTSFLKINAVKINLYLGNSGWEKVADKKHGKLKKGDDVELQALLPLVCIDYFTHLLRSVCVRTKMEKKWIDEWFAAKGKDFY